MDAGSDDLLTNLCDCFSPRWKRLVIVFMSGSLEEGFARNLPFICIRNEALHLTYFCSGGGEGVHVEFEVSQEALIGPIMHGALATKGLNLHSICPAKSKESRSSSGADLVKFS